LRTRRLRLCDGQPKATQRLSPCASLRERTCARLVSFSKLRCTLLRSQRDPFMCMFKPVADTGGDSSRNEPPCSPGYRCHGSDSILISLNGVSCILERRSNGQCIIDRCKTGVAHLTDELCAYQTSTRRQTPSTSIWGKGWYQIPEQQLSNRV